MKKRIIELSVDNRSEVIVLPVNPQTVELRGAQQNQRITLLNVGEVNLTGNKGLVTTSLSSFFPSSLSPFWKYAGKEPKEYIATFEKWKDTGKIVRLIITDIQVNLAMIIDSFSYSMNEGDQDVYYTIELSEYRKLNIPAVQDSTLIKNNGLKDRPNTEVTGKTHTVVSGDTLWAIAKKYYGDGSQYTKIYNANKDNIKNSSLIYPGQVFMIP